MLHARAVQLGVVAGQTISHFKIVSKFAEGGIGVVYKAEEEAIGKVRAAA